MMDAIVEALRIVTVVGAGVCAVCLVLFLAVIWYDWSGMDEDDRE